jgi:hypothetical protein
MSFWLASELWEDSLVVAGQQTLSLSLSPALQSILMHHWL